MTDASVLLPSWLETLATALQSPAQTERVARVRPGIGGRAAAVLVLIGAGERGPEILFVERASTLRTHAGQIAFPGGAADAGDVDLVDTALREAAEEAGVQRCGVQVLGALPPVHVAVSGFDVTAVVAWWREPAAVDSVDVREVASAPVVPVAELTDPARRATAWHPLGYTGPAFEVPGHLIWGLTAHLLDAVLDLAGWQRPWDPSRRVEVPARYLTSRTRTDTGGPDAH